MVMAGTGCDSGRSGSHANTVRDSSGVTIVESVSPSWGRSAAWRIDTSSIVRIGEGEPIERMPVDPVSVFRTPAGEIVVADGNQAGWHNVLVYDAQGRWLRTLGRKGEGPCEFGQVWWAAPYIADSVAVFDMSRNMVHVLGSDGGCGESVRVPRQLEGRQPQPGGFTNMAYAVYPDGTFLMAPQGAVANPDAAGPTFFTQDLIRVDRTGTIRHVLGPFDIGSIYWDGRMASSLRFGPIADRVLDGLDLVYGSGRAYEIQRFDSAGRLTRVVRRRVDPDRVTRSDQERLLSRSYVGGGGEHGGRPISERSLDERIRQSHWAEFKPFYRTILIDSRRNMWVETFRVSGQGFDILEDENAGWSVFDPAGTWLGDVSVPPRFFLKTIYDDAVFGVWQDANGVTTVRSYRLVKPD